MITKEDLARVDLKVASEIGKLKKLLVHRPDDGIEKVSPSLAVELLYEDIVFLPRMQQEHDLFVNAISWFIGKENIYEVQALLAEVLKENEHKKFLLEYLKASEGVDNNSINILSALEAGDLAYAAITGITPGGAQQLNPIPNLIFTRDIGVMINDHLLITRAGKKARLRESMICHLIFQHHPLFLELQKNNKIIDVFSGFSDDHSLEGGDIMMFDKGHLLIGYSERSKIETINKIIEKLFEQDVVKMISVVDMPKSRSCMHLDTIFTRISRDCSIGFAPLVSVKNSMLVSHYVKGVSKVTSYASIKDLINDYYPDMEIIPCGEGIAPYDEREQWTDGCNLFAVKEGVAFTYERNMRTNNALRERGYNIVPVEELLRDFQEDNIRPENVTKTIITIPSSELSRARGGTHCLTMPLLRD
jgi:arginine deiminase